MSEELSPLNQPLNPLSELSVTEDLERLRELATPVEPLFGTVGFRGQANVWYADPNSGKTLLAHRFLMDAISEGRVKASEVFYFNMDDTSQGLVEKIEIAKEYGFNVIAPNEKGFRVQNTMELLDKVVKSGSARSTIVLLDTLKKCVDIMSKGESSIFGAAIRAFVQAGGTALLLAHTNKNKSSEGKTVHAGTADFPQDMDCVYMITVEPTKDKTKKIVKFENVKKRGCAPDEVVYSYSTVGERYRNLVDSVEIVDENSLLQAKEEAQREADEDAIEAIKWCIQDGKVNKMDLVKASSQQLKISQNKVTKIIERYTGDDVEKFHWQFTVVRNGMQKFSLLRSIHYNPEDF